MYSSVALFLKSSQCYLAKFYTSILNLWYDLYSIQLHKILNMKKIIVAFSFILGAVGFAQAQTTDSATPPSSSNQKGMKDQSMKSNSNMKQMLENANLTQDQKKKVMDFKKSSKTKEDAINNNKSLSDTDRQTQLKDLRKQTKKNILSILTPEQKKQMMQEKSGDEKTPPPPPPPPANN